MGRRDHTENRVLKTIAICRIQAAAFINKDLLEHTVLLATFKVATADLNSFYRELAVFRF